MGKSEKDGVKRIKRGSQLNGPLVKASVCEDSSRVQAFTFDIFRDQISLSPQSPLISALIPIDTHGLARGYL